jgi:uncharacterized RDD family membrane protein YckC
MSSVQDDRNPFAPPNAQVEDVPVDAGTSVLAGRWRRFFGSVIDGLLDFAVMWAVAFASPSLFEQTEDVFFGFSLRNSVLAFVAWLLLNAYPLHTASQTWAKKMLGMRIVRLDRSPASFARIVGLRYGVPSLFSLMPVAAWVFALVDSLFIFRASRRCLHDSIAGTLVVRT